MDFLQQAFEVASNAVGRSEPNPSVGAIITYNDKIIGKGCTSYHGGNHAEVNAILNVKKQYGTSILKKSHLYVTLEPCSHYGKTPPCTTLILKYKIPRVTIAYKDPSAKIQGNGIHKLREEGTFVELLYPPQYQHEKNYTLGPFFYSLKKEEPQIILKWAQTKEGYLAPQKKASKQISGKEARTIMHKARELYRAILVTPGTIITDSPKLTSRYAQEPITHHATNHKYFHFLLNRTPNTHEENLFLCHRYFMLPSISHKFTLQHLKEFIKMQKEIKGNVTFFTIEAEQAKVLEKQFVRSIQVNTYDDLNPIFNRILNDGYLQVMIEAGPTFLEFIVKNYHINSLLVFISHASQRWKGRDFSLSTKIYQDSVKYHNKSTRNSCTVNKKMALKHFTLEDQITLKEDTVCFFNQTNK